jgi:hypothetical protein
MPLSGKLIRCQSNHDVYARSCGGVALSGDDEMDISSRVPDARPHMGACGYTLSWLALNDHAIRGCQLSGHLPGIGGSRVWLTGSRARADLGHKDGSNRADMWQDRARP